MPKLSSLAIFAGLILLALGALHFSPLPQGLNNQPVAKLLLASNNELLAARIASDQQWRFPRTHELPPKYVTAVTTFEDKYFFQHFGINPFSLLKALWGNAKNGHIVSGGSTITMQLARLIRKDPPRTYWNKIVELFIALKIEWHYSKESILSLYASNAPFGGNTVGIGAANWRYFGRYQNSPSWAQAALLAVLPNSPALIHPGRGRVKLKVKRDRLLKKLFKLERITKNELKLSILEPLPNKPKPLPQLAPHLLQGLLVKHPSVDTLNTSIDAALQNKLKTLGAFSGKKLAAEGVHNLSMIIINNRDLTASAYIGNVATGSNRQRYSPSVDIATRPRSTGSILKPLLYGLMLQSGDILPNTLVADVPSNFNGFTPENYDHQYRGAVPAWQALSQSLNIPSVRMLKKYGVPRFQDNLKQLGMSTLFRPPSDYGLSLILGGAEGNLWELTAIYARLMNAARDELDRSPKKSVTILKGLTKNKDQDAFILKQGAAWLTLNAMHEVTRPGGERQWRDFSSSQQIAWKTGTSYGLRDAWAIGSNGKYTVGVWAGNADGAGVAGLSGFKTAAPVLFQIFDLLGHARWVEKPVLALKEVLTCIDDGYLAAGKCDAEASLAPVNSHFQEVTPFHKQVLLDKTGLYRVHGGCESVSNIQVKSWLILPPVQEYYWRRNHNEFESLPPWREDCIAGLANYTSDMPMDIIYPLEGSKVYIPYELNGEKGRVVFKASHRQKNSKLFWHIDDQFIQTTTLFHDITLDLSAGWHKLILLDELGFRLERWFKVLALDGF